jgi:hypothetical protein
LAAAIAELTEPQRQELVAAVRLLGVLNDRIRRSEDQTAPGSGSTTR